MTAVKQNACPVCQQGNRKLGETTFAVDLGFGVVVVRRVPALICEQCSSEWLEDSTAEKLEQIVEEARIKHPVVEVANWEDEVKALAS
ncbi:YgiT-type zinc finger protein [Marinospirillum sp.]|uniref:YgiT-type zinc finger protein n=1 Tax=Marinospirillum sp. TaxID=2183934 RepID=UPI00384B2175